MPSKFWSPNAVMLLSFGFAGSECVFPGGNMFVQRTR